ncbi:MAG TPA: hypothetical protein VF622_18730, partial [Segetibacter sp.]
KPFWSFQNNSLLPQYDTTKWVWNSEMTLFNRKGFEIENKDPLGRYNSGLYGYNYTLPTAVVQNSRYQEAAFEGFEDYGMSGNNCDTICGSRRHIDFKPSFSQLTTTEKHSGKYSLQINSSEQVSLATNVLPSASEVQTEITFARGANCSGNSSLKSIGAKSATLPDFALINNSYVLISAWVKEGQDCKCEKYINNEIVVAISGSDGSSQSRTFKAKGNIIEGWQRYEDTIFIPQNAKSVSLTLKATGNSTVYFDDIRIHPFNANMKSFVYHPVNLRLMAELDENNYATFYEYDDDGTLIRVKKETERGIKTIKETRSALLKEVQ